eukprot:8376408-Alexandrium_andersonii.AAC.1
MEMVPSELATQVAHSPSKWFNQWVESGCSWGRVLYVEQQREKNSRKTDKDRTWLWSHEVDSAFPKQVATALKNSLRGTEFHRTYPGTDNELLEQFR